MRPDVPPPRYFGETFERPGPTSSIAQILAKVMKEHGIGSDPAHRKAVAAWRAAVGSELFERTKVGTVRKGVLSVEVDSAALLQELSVYRRRELLTALRRADPSISEVKFRTGGRGRSGK